MRESEKTTHKSRSNDDVTAEIKRRSIYLKKRVVVALGKKRAATVSYDEAWIIARAVDVIGDKNEAMRWMGTPVRALDYSTPVSLLGTRKGRQAVITVLGRLEHGVL